MSPWTGEDVLRWAATTAFAAAVCVVAWYLAGRDARFASQVGPANLAVAGLVIAGYAQAAWLLRGRRAVGLRSRRLLVVQPGKGARLPANRQSGDGARLVAGPRLVYFHRPDCALTEGRRWPAAPAAEHVAQGRSPCGVCRP